MDKVDGCLIGLFFGIICGAIGGAWTGHLATRNDIEKSCLYGDYLQFNTNVFSCTYQPNITIMKDEEKPSTNKQRLKEILK